MQVANNTNTHNIHSCRIHNAMLWQFLRQNTKSQNQYVDCEIISSVAKLKFKTRDNSVVYEIDMSQADFEEDIVHLDLQQTNMLYAILQKTSYLDLVSLCQYLSRRYENSFFYNLALRCKSECPKNPANKILAMKTTPDTIDFCRFMERTFISRLRINNASSIASFAISRDSCDIAILTHGGRLSVNRINDLSTICEMTHPGSPVYVKFSRDNRFIVTHSRIQNGYFDVWIHRSDDLTVCQHIEKCYCYDFNISDSIVMAAVAEADTIKVKRWSIQNVDNIQMMWEFDVRYLGLDITLVRDIIDVNHDKFQLVAFGRESGANICRIVSIKHSALKIRPAASTAPIANKTVFFRNPIYKTIWVQTNGPINNNIHIILQHDKSLIHYVLTHDLTLAYKHEIATDLSDRTLKLERQNIELLENIDNVDIITMTEMETYITVGYIKINNAGSELVTLMD